MSVTLETSVGPLKIELFCEEAPKCCENFLALCASGYYDKTSFHRNIKGFLIQGGDPTGTGKGGQSIWGKPFDDEIVPTLTHSRRGIVSMASSGKNRNKSQFFITYSKQPDLDGRYSIFGHVISHFETLDALERLEPDSEAPVIRSVVIHANPIADLQW
eukprot:TRINITY_DN1298_c0_g1_i1.p1 TRINITY_DN1298_c0_g1~~TRINITY_DN1298_c0_g1_i1.p1  ORF type:complete len:159 (+),score=27.13 TRINITY_DN1298_c0_g1_i1:122-598(+)